MWAMKGQRPDAEMARLPVGAYVRRVEPLTVPFLDAQRHLVEIHVEPA
jgi:16S rRNA (guanine527-N7)-methyltransferase